MSHCYRSYGAYSVSVFRLSSRDFNQTAQNWSCGSSAKASSFQSSPNRWTTVRPHIGKTKLQSFKTALTKRDKGRLRFSCFFWNTFWICHWPHSRLRIVFLILVQSVQHWPEANSHPSRTRRVSDSDCVIEQVRSKLIQLESTIRVTFDYRWSVVRCRWSSDGGTVAHWAALTRPISSCVAWSGHTRPNIE